MPSIGELFVTLGAKVDGSVERGLRQLQQLGQTAAQATQRMNNVAKGSAAVWSQMAQAVGVTNMAMANLGGTSRTVAAEIRGIGGAMKAVNRDVKDLALNANDVIRRQAGVARSAAESARLRMFTPGNAALETLRNRLGGGNVDEGPGMFGIGQRNRTSWANFLAGAPTPVGPERYFPSFGGVPPGRTPGRLPGGGGGGAGAGGGGRFGGGGFNRFGGPVGELAGIRRMILGAGIYQSIQEMAQLSDSYTNIQNRLRQVTSSQQEMNTTYERLHGIANTSQADLKGVSEAYVRIKLSTDRMGLSGEDTFKVVNRITEAFALSGASTQEANGAMTQLTQAFNSNKLAGDEFRTMTEQMPSILKMLAVTMKVPEDRLKQMAKEGRITRKVLVDTLLAANHLDTDIQKRGKTFSGYWNTFKNDIMKPIGESLGNPEVQAAFVEVLKGLAFVIVQLARIVPPLVKSIASFIKGLRDGEPWAIVLATAIGLFLLPQVILLVTWFGRLFALPFTSFLGNLTKLKALAKGDLATALGPTAAAGGAGAAGTAGVGAGTAAAGASVIPLVGQSIAAGLMLREGAKYAAKDMGLDAKTGGWFSTIMGTSGPGLSEYGASMMTPDEILRVKAGGKVGLGDIGGAVMRGAGGSSPNVNIGPTNVTIYAKDGKDAADQFTEELINRRNREAAAVFNRSGS